MLKYYLLDHIASNMYAQVTEVYGNFIGYNIVWCCEFLNGRMIILDELRQGWPNVINEDSVNMA